MCQTSIDKMMSIDRTNQEKELSIDSTNQEYERENRARLVGNDVRIFMTMLMAVRSTVDYLGSQNRWRSHLL